MGLSCSSCSACQSEHCQHSRPYLISLPAPAHKCRLNSVSSQPSFYGAGREWKKLITSPVEKSDQGKHPGTSGSNGMLGAARCTASQSTPRIGPLWSAGRRQQKETRHRCLQHILQLSKIWRFSGDSWTEVDKGCALRFFTFLLFFFSVNVSFKLGETGVGMFWFQSHHGELFPPDESRVNLSLYLPSPPPLLSDWEEARGACCRVALPARRCLDGATHCGARPHTGPQVMFVGVQPDPTPAPRCLVLPHLPSVFGLGFEG